MKPCHGLLADASGGSYPARSSVLCGGVFYVFYLFLPMTDRFPEVSLAISLGAFFSCTGARELVLQGGGNAN